ncbi:MAG: diguanylate cyclase, partial [Pseudomonadota bacterium]
LIGFLMLRNFSAPLERLVAAAKEVSEGRFPDFSETENRDEVGYLWNQFASMVRRLRDKQEEVNKAHAQLERIATTDALTGLYNRHYLYEVFPKLHSEARRQGKTLTVILADVDRFKEVNDRYGHQVGDRALAHFAGVLKDCTRISDFVFRTGGEEFMILVSGDFDGGLTMAEKIRAMLESTSLTCEGQQIRMTASFGVAQTEAGDGKMDSRSVLYSVSSRADKMLYTAKRAGRNRVAAG